jgi:adenylosuccinate lyase
LFDQINKDQYDDFEEHIPSETDIWEVLPPDAIGTLGMSYQQINSTIDCLSEYETKIRENIDKQTLYIHKLRNEIEKAYKESTEYPYVLHAVIIHEGEALSGHYYR